MSVIKVFIVVSVIGTSALAQNSSSQIQGTWFFANVKCSAGSEPKFNPFGESNADSTLQMIISQNNIKDIETIHYRSGVSCTEENNYTYEVLPNNVIEGTAAESKSDCPNFNPNKKGVKSSVQFSVSGNKLDLTYSDPAACGEESAIATFLKVK